ncbi:hypothetical protein CTM97_19340 [Photobacterium phosphoreum]|uniref:Uncharacterized protein n=1 Tax=Photobacterium phosphoreum TaxID=659 RepID=A0A2T3JQ51_PHOPO|nr:hypothetical protein [Photobacterium phosphoreum]PSU24686.1 hypothetical protein CTM96_12155 [Photobacterium phosphoreum]PSU38246.1 hypothetical protein CTM97_19340 [Photobacterium phosphoreum]PSU51140.1 hypothetical protein C9J18_13175 [Photobacterium phosphoreum]
MAKVIAQTMRDTVYAGAAGNLSIAFGKIDVKAAVVDTEIEMLELPIGLEVVGVRVATESGLGADVTLDIKLNNKVIASAVNVATQSSVVIPIQPFYLVEKTVLTVVVKGAAATGSVSVMPEYVSVGF